MTTRKTFKSDRAAKMAFNKAEKAWKEMQSKGWSARDTIRETMRKDGRMASTEYDTLKATEDQCERDAKVLFDEMREIYEAAKAQGITIDTFGANWHFGQNTTRDLIAANMD